VENGIIHERTPPYSLQSNGVAERKNRTLIDLMNAMLGTSSMAKAWWGEAVLTVCHVLIRVSTKNSEVTPYEGWKGRKPSLYYLRTWGCLAMVSIPVNKKCKLGPKTIDCIFLGYAHHSTAYKFLAIKFEASDVLVDTLLESRDVTFFENIFPMNVAYSLLSSSNEFIREPTPSIEPIIDPVGIEEDNNIVASRRSKRQRVENPLVTTSLSIS